MPIAASGGQFIIIQIKAPRLLFSLLEVKSGNGFRKSAESLPSEMCKNFPTRQWFRFGRLHERTKFRNQHYRKRETKSPYGNF